jgi:very-short-patch-repair endonuclease
MDIDALSQKVFESLVDDFRQHCIAATDNFASLCESPIEVLLGASMMVGFNFTAPSYICIGHPSSETSVLVLVPQYQWEQYRIDFCIYPRAHPSTLVFIECDGHDFHERTKEQAASDRKKDRSIQQSGIPILRFTGSEIYRDPLDCGAQVMTFLNKNIARLLK